MRSCAVISGKNLGELRLNAEEAKRMGADLVEICINDLEDHNDLELLNSFSLPVILTCTFTKDQIMLSAVRKALKFKVEFVDLDLTFPKDFIEGVFSHARSNNIKTIISYYPGSFPVLKTAKKLIGDMAILSKHIKLVLPAKNRKDLESLGEVFAAATKAGTKIVILNSSDSGEAALDRRNFIGYGKISDGEKCLPSLEAVKRSIIETAETRSI